MFRESSRSSSKGCFPESDLLHLPKQGIQFTRAGGFHITGDIAHGLVNAAQQRVSGLNLYKDFASGSLNTGAPFLCHPDTST